MDPAEPYCYVTTTGRRTGCLHTVEIWFGAQARTLYLLSGGGARSDWVRNLRQDPRVHVRIGDEEWQAEAREVLDPGEDALARRLLAAKYQGWREGLPLSEWARTALPWQSTSLSRRRAVRRRGAGGRGDCGVEGEDEAF